MASQTPGAGEESWLDSWGEWWESPSWPWYDWFQGLSRCISFVGAALRIYAGYRLSQMWAGLQPDTAALNRHCAQRALELVLSMKGYYIKAAQTLCGSGVFAEEFDEAFAELLDQCPKEAFETVQAIVESELGCALGEVFADFGQEAVAAASIGQVHLGKLHNGTEVAVKVQYPEVERYFRMDVRGLEFLLWLQGAGPKVKELCDSMGLQFQAEFDYKVEATHLRECAECVRHDFGQRVAIPMPIDEEHPAHPGRSLCTRKVLTMERLRGVPIRQHTMQLVDAFARTHGLDPKELKKLLRDPRPSTAASLDPALLQRLLTMGPVPESAMAAAVAAAKLQMGCMGFLRRICCCAPPPTGQDLLVPLNGPRIARTLYEVHGYEMFHHGVYNSDPHAGNIFVLEDGRLGLLDYGAVSRLSLEERLHIARLIVAVADEDDASVPDAMFACGFESKNMDPRLALLMGFVCFHRGPHPDDLKRLGPKVGLPEDIDVLGLEEFMSSGQLDEVTRFPPELLSLQRCAMVLSGTALELGAGRLSSARMLKPQALALLHKEQKGA